MTLKIRIRNVYGNELVYPKCAKSRIFAEIAGFKTLTFSTIKRIKELGYTFEVISPELN